jgi:hypothetical protein
MTTSTPSVGQADTPIGQLPIEVWFEFLSRFIQAFEAEMRRMIAEAEAPF